MTPEAQIQQRRHDATTEERARSQTSTDLNAPAGDARVFHLELSEETTCGCLGPCTLHDGISKIHKSIKKKKNINGTDHTVERKMINNTKQSVES